MYKSPSSATMCSVVVLQSFGVFRAFFTNSNWNTVVVCCLIHNCFRWSTVWNEEVNIAHLWKYSFYWIPRCSSCVFVWERERASHTYLMMMLAAKFYWYVHLIHFLSLSYFVVGNGMWCMLCNRTMQIHIPYYREEEAKLARRRETKKRIMSRTKSKCKITTTTTNKCTCRKWCVAATIISAYNSTKFHWASKSTHNKNNNNNHREGKKKCRLWSHRECEHWVSNIVDKVHFG